MNFIYYEIAWSQKILSHVDFMFQYVENVLFFIMHPDYPTNSEILHSQSPNSIFVLK